MTKYLLEMFLTSLLLTLLLELPVAWCFGVRRKKEFALVFLVNVLTNPPAVALYWLGIPQIPIELAVFLTEAGMFYLFSKDRTWNIPRPLLLALVANTVSWSCGMLIQRIGGFL